MNIKQTALVAAFVFALPAGAAMAQTMPTAEQCTAWYGKLDAKNTGSITPETLAPLMTAKSGGAATAAPTAPVTKEAFLAECAKGTYGMPSM